MLEQPNISNNEEIEKALKEFESKSNQPQNTSTGEHPINAVITPQNPQNQNREVEGVKFETESYRAIKLYKETVTPKMVSVIIKYSGGAIKEERQAEWVLLGFVFVVMGISLYLVFGFGHTQQKITPAMIEQARRMPQKINR